MKPQRLLSILLLTSLAVLSVSQPGPPPGGGSGATVVTETEQNNNMFLDATISGLAEDQWISGTNVRFNTNMGARSVPLEDPAPTDWYQAKLSSFTIKIGGQVVRTWDGTQPAPPNPPIRGCAVRFMSTRFDDGSTITISVEAIFDLQNYASAGTNVWNLSVPVTVERDVKVYNKVFGAANSIDSTGAQDAAILSESQAIVDSGISAAVAAKHSDIGTAADNVYTKAQILTMVEAGTMFIGTTHGSRFDFTASSSKTNILFNPDITGAMSLRPSGRPPYNLIVSYSCSTLAGPSVTAHESMGISISSEARAYLGYEQDTDWDMDMVCTHQHCSRRLRLASPPNLLPMKRILPIL